MRDRANYTARLDMNHMPATPLQIARNLHVTTLIDIENPTFAKDYHDGLCSSLNGDYKGNKPFSDVNLVANLKRDAAHGYFDGQHEDRLLNVGFYLGSLHGCLLSPRIGQLRPDATALVMFNHPDTARGYRVGRRDCYMDPTPESRIYTDIELIEELCQIALDLASYPHEENSWYYSICCMLGNLSAQVFPATPEEYQQSEAEHRLWQERYEQDMA
jgi:hypothetical protein